MRRRWIWGLLLLLVCVPVIAALAPPAGAQGEPVPYRPRSCADNSLYDLNHDGMVSAGDFTMWVIAVHEGAETCKLNGPASGCPSWVDVNRDGVVSHADLDAIFRFIATCVWPSPIVRP